MSELKKKIEEFSEIAKTLPDNLQVICFELLLRNHLEGSRSPREKPKPAPDPENGPIPKFLETVTPDAAGRKQEDLKIMDLHLKAKKFLDKYALSIEQLNNLFFREGGELKPLYEDLKTTKMSESQIRVTLLLALRNAITHGEFQTDVEAVRAECAQRKCYDTTNFGANYNNNKSYFDFDKFGKETTSVRLSEAGRKKLAELIKEMQ